MPTLRRESLKWWTNLCGIWTGAVLAKQSGHEILFSGQILLESDHGWAEFGHFFTESGQGQFVKINLDIKLLFLDIFCGNLDIFLRNLDIFSRNLDKGSL